MYCQRCWWSDGWSAGEYAQDFDPGRPFLEQLRDLFRRMPLPALWGYNNTNCDYANFVANSKNCYFSFSIVDGEDIYYSSALDRSKECFDCSFVQDSERCYGLLNSRKCHGSKWLVNSRECINSAFLYDCANCQDCFMSSNLRNKRYVFRNRQLSKEEYAAEMAAVDLGAASQFASAKMEFAELCRRALHKYAEVHKAERCTGDDIVESKNARDSFRVQQAEDVRYIWRFDGLKNSMDVSGGIKSELLYEISVGGGGNYGAKFAYQGKDSRYIEYGILLINSSYCFGSIGLRNKQHCILNKQYSPEEYSRLRKRIIEQMVGLPYRDALGRVYMYGEFFPPEFSPFAYQETVAQEYFPLTKDEVTRSGYNPLKKSTSNYEVTLSNDSMPAHVSEADDALTREIIGCAHAGECREQCVTAFRILPQELSFYRQAGLALPRLCPNCRNGERVRMFAPLHLNERRCQCAGSAAADGGWTNASTHFHGSAPCPNEFQSPYAPDGPEVVYCEQCYQSEVS